jgi:hypothetical protein
MECWNKEKLKDFFQEKRVVLFGSAPSCLQNNGLYIDNFDIIVRTNNYKVFKRTSQEIFYDFTANVGNRTDVFYTFFGSSVKKTIQELKKDGVKLIFSKCPNGKLLDHTVIFPKDKSNFGGEWTWIYRLRENVLKEFDHYIPDLDTFKKYFNLLGGHIPTTGFQAILEIVALKPKELYITGFDFFTSGLHNTNESWNEKNFDDPIRHVPMAELQALRLLIEKHNFIKVDKTISKMI